MGNKSEFEKYSTLGAAAAAAVLVEASVNPSSYPFFFVKRALGTCGPPPLMQPQIFVLFVTNHVQNRPHFLPFLSLVTFFRTSSICTTMSRYYCFKPMAYTTLDSQWVWLYHIRCGDSPPFSYWCTYCTFCDRTPIFFISFLTQFQKP